MSTLCRSTVKILLIITSVWLFYFLSGFMLIGPIKVEISVEEDHETVKLTRGYRAFLIPRSRMLCRLIESLHILASATSASIFIFYIGNVVRKLLDKTITNGKGVFEAGNMAFILKSIATSVLFSVTCLIVVNLITNNLYLKSLARMEHHMAQFVSRHEKVPSVYLYKVEPSLAFYYSLIIIGFLLSFSHWVPLIFQIVLSLSGRIILPNEDSKDGLIVNIDMYREDLLQNNQGRLTAKNAETAIVSSPLLDNPTGLASIKENELSIILV